MERDNFQCQMCFDEKKTLNVHHHFYKDYMKPWEYRPANLITLCDKCHKSLHTYIDNIDCGAMDDVRSEMWLIGYYLACWKRIDREFFERCLTMINKFHRDGEELFIKKGLDNGQKIH